MLWSMFSRLTMADLSATSYAVRGYCALCTAHCATITTVENGRVTRLDPDPDHPNGGVMCIIVLTIL